MQHTIRSLFTWARIDPEPIPPEHVTTLFADGMLIINEDKANDREANIAEHGEVVKEYEPGTYSFTNTNQQPWHEDKSSILAVKFGSEYKATNLAYLFQGIGNVASIDLTNLDTSEATNMRAMFRGCQRALTSLDLSSFSTSKVTNMREMFMSCSEIRTIFVGGGFVTEQVTSSTNMFDGMLFLEGGAGTQINDNYTDKTYARIDNPPDAPGYFTAKV